MIVQPALIDAHFRKAWMPFLRRERRDPVTPQAFLDFVGSYLEQAREFELPMLTGDATVLARKTTSGGLDGWG